MAAFVLDIVPIRNLEVIAMAKTFWLISCC
jgi:hypothetical protein